MTKTNTKQKLTTYKIIGDLTIPLNILAGWPIVGLTRQKFAQLMVADCLASHTALQKPAPKLFFSVNGHSISLAHRDHDYNCALEAADYIHVDGQPLVFASKFFSNTPLPERVATTDYFHDAALVGQEKGLRNYFLGASEKMNAEAVSNVRNIYPNLKIAGNRHGYFEQNEEVTICQKIVDSRTDVLWVGLGKPKEQLFCVRNIDRLQGVGWVITCGGLFDFLGGRNKRSPKWMQDAGLEWLHRLLQDPRRFLWRYLVTNIHAVLLLWSADDPTCRQ